MNVWIWRMVVSFESGLFKLVRIRFFPFILYILSSINPLLRFKYSVHY